MSDDWRKPTLSEDAAVLFDERQFSDPNEVGFWTEQVRAATFDPTREVTPEGALEYAAAQREEWEEGLFADLAEAAYESKAACLVVRVTSADGERLGDFLCEDVRSVDSALGLLSLDAGARRLRRCEDCPGEGLALFYGEGVSALLRTSPTDRLPRYAMEPTERRWVTRITDPDVFDALRYDPLLAADYGFDLSAEPEDQAERSWYDTCIEASWETVNDASGSGIPDPVSHVAAAYLQTYATLPEVREAIEGSDDLVGTLRRVATEHAQADFDLVADDFAARAEQSARDVLDRMERSRPKDPFAGDLPKTPVEAAMRYLEREGLRDVREARDGSVTYVSARDRETIVLVGVQTADDGRGAAYGDVQPIAERLASEEGVDVRADVAIVIDLDADRGTGKIMYATGVWDSRESEALGHDDPEPARSPRR